MESKDEVIAKKFNILRNCNIKSAATESEWRDLIEDYFVGGDEGSDGDSDSDFDSEWEDVDEKVTLETIMAATENHTST